MTGKFVPGNPGGGRVHGSKNHMTLVKQGLAKLAELEGEEADELEVKMMANAVKKAIEGNYQFYKDYMDRKYGQAVARTENKNVNASLHKLQEEEKQRLDDLIK